MSVTKARRRPFWRRVELPTWGLATAIYAGWLLLTWHASSLPLWLSAPLGGWLVAWHGSLQHEGIHGHPTRSPRLNALLVGWPLWLYLPYPLYRDSHLAHHASPAITDPFDDPESWYVDRERWDALPAPVRGFHALHATLAGRLLLGPPYVVGRLLVDEIRRLARGDLRHLRAWAVHLVVVAVLLTWIVGVCGLSLGTYVLCFAYPGLSLTLLRSYAEHRPAATQHRRTAIVETGPVLGLLFLHNNLHALHHAKPRLPWFEYHRSYRDERPALLARNGGYLIPGYGALLWRHAFRAKDAPIHPET